MQVPSNFFTPAENFDRIVTFDSVDDRDVDPKYFAFIKGLCKPDLGLYCAYEEVLTYREGKFTALQLTFAVKNEEGLELLMNVIGKARAAYLAAGITTDTYQSPVRLELHWATELIDEDDVDATPHWQMTIDLDRPHRNQKILDVFTEVVLGLSNY